MIKELGARLGLDTGTLTPLFYRMEDNRWITRQRSHKDSRQVYLELTSKAKKEEKEIKNSVSACFKVIDMTSVEYKKSVNLLMEITNKLNDLNENLSHKKC